MTTNYIEKMFENTEIQIETDHKDSYNFDYYEFLNSDQFRNILLKTDISHEKILYTLDNAIKKVLFYVKYFKKDSTRQINNYTYFAIIESILISKESLACLARKELSDEDIKINPGEWYFGNITDYTMDFLRNRWGFFY